MGATWESAIFTGVSDLHGLAVHVAGVAEACKAPRVLLHFMKALEPNGALVSAELTAFRNRRVEADGEELRKLTDAVFDSPELAFRGPEVLLAKVLSERVERCLYLSYHDSYNSGGYVLFEAGSPSRFELVGWEGSDGVVANVESDGSGPTAISRGLGLMGWKSETSAIESVFGSFYGEESETASYLMKDKGVGVSPPQPV